MIVLAGDVGGELDYLLDTRAQSGVVIDQQETEEQTVPQFIIPKARLPVGLIRSGVQVVLDIDCGLCDDYLLNTRARSRVVID